MRHVIRTLTRGAGLMVLAASMLAMATPPLAAAQAAPAKPAKPAKTAPAAAPAAGQLLDLNTATRDQLKNRDDATSKLALIVRAALARPTPRRATKPSRSAKRRRVADKRHHAEIKRNRSGKDD